MPIANDQDLADWHSKASPEAFPIGSVFIAVVSTTTTDNPIGGVAQGTTDGPSATLTHSVTQPSAHTDLNVVQPYIVCYFWKRTA